MSLTHRIFIFDDCFVSPIAKSAFDGFFLRRKGSLSEHAGKTINVAMVICDLENRKPSRIVRIYTMKIDVAKDGSRDPTWWEKYSKVAAGRPDRIWPTLGSSEEPEENNVLNAQSEFAQRRWNAYHPKLSPTAQQRILDILFGTSKGK